MTIFHAGFAHISRSTRKRIWRKKKTFKTAFGYVELVNNPYDYDHDFDIDIPMLWVWINKDLKLFKGIDNMFTDSRIFNGHVHLEVYLSDEAGTWVKEVFNTGDKLDPEQWVKKHFPINGGELTLSVSHPYREEEPLDFKKQREATALSVWEISGYIWSALVGTFTVVVGLFLFSIATTPFENVVLAILVLIYSSIVFRASGAGLVLVAFGNEFSELFHLLHRSGYEGDTWQDSRYKGMKAQKKALINMYMNVGSCFFLWAIAVWKLLSSVWGL